MKYTLALAALSQLASAHYFFDTVVGSGTGAVRKITGKLAYNPVKFSSNPAADIREGSTIDGPDGVCNRGNTAAGEVLTVAAGEKVTVKLGVGAKMEHPGPALVYMSKAAGDVKSYDGSGDWFKIFEEGVCNQGASLQNNAWCTWGRDTITAAIPKDTPNGEYLMRFEHIGVHRSHVNQPEHYMSCVQVKVTGGGNGTPGPMIKFPSGYKSTDAYANYNIYVPKGDFPMPGPAVWKSGAAAGGAAAAPAPAAPATPAPAAPAPATPAPVQAAAPAPAPAAPKGNCSGMWGQCGGRGYTGPTCCSAGSCKLQPNNPYYAQCL